MICIPSDLRKLAWASALALASLPTPQVLAAATPAPDAVALPTKSKSAPATATCSNNAQDCQAGADAQRPEAREPQGTPPAGLCAMRSSELEASLRLRCPKLYGPLYA